MSSFTEAWSGLVQTYDPRTIIIGSIVCIQILFFYIPSTLLTLLDLYFPAFSRRHKIQSAAKQPTVGQILDAVYISLVNNIISTALQWFMYFYLDMDPRLTVSPELPSLSTVAYEVLSLSITKGHSLLMWSQFLAGLITREVVFYYVHRFLHSSPKLYQSLHKKHHAFTAPNAFAAQYCTFVEHILANTIPITLAHMVLRAHVVSFWCFVVFQVVEAAGDHCGYKWHFGWPLTAEHDAHHENWRGNYGTLGWMDWLHDTHRVIKREEAKPDNGEGGKMKEYRGDVKAMN